MLNFNKNILIEIKVGEQRTGRMGWQTRGLALCFCNDASTDACKCPAAVKKWGI